MQTRQLIKTVKALTIALAFLACEAAIAAPPKTATPAIKTTSQIIKETAPKGITAAFYKCVDEPMHNSERLVCVDAERQRQDARLNTAYKALLLKLNDNAKQALIKSERSWLAFHEESYAFEDMIYAEDYTARGIEILQGQIFRLCERANVLEQYLGVVNLQ